MLILQLFVNGVSAGATYALIAVGFAIIYNGTRVLHIAHGGVYAASGYVFYVCLGFMPLPLAVVATVCAASAIGVAMELLVYRPLRDRAEKASDKDAAHAALIASLGLMTLIQSGIALGFGTDTFHLRQGSLPIYIVGDIVFTQLNVVALAVAIAIFALLHLFLSRTRYGRAVRALSDNPGLATVVGIDRNRFNLVIYAVGSGLAGVAVALIGFDLGVRPEMGFEIMFVAIVACIVGGMGYLPAAAAGAFFLGILEHLSLWKLSGGWQDVVLFGTLILFLLFRPQGMFGHLLVTRRA